MKGKIRCYSELIMYPDFTSRFEYLKLDSKVGVSTFGFDRYINQQLYKSRQWHNVRHKIIMRDNACDLGMIDHDILDKIIIHHMNPISVDDICNCEDYVFDPEYLICVTHTTHNAIHFGDKRLIKNNDIRTRTKHDTCPWK